MTTTSRCGGHPSFLQGIIITIPPGYDGAAAAARESCCFLVASKARGTVACLAAKFSDITIRTDTAYGLPVTNKGQSVCLDSDIYRQTIASSATFFQRQRGQKWDRGVFAEDSPQPAFVLPLIGRHTIPSTPPKSQWFNL
jgi:hypothetical protein